MSAAGRAAHSHNKNRHAQRTFGAVKATLQPVGTDTAWVAEFISLAEGTGPFDVHSILALPLGATPEEREQNLRKASSMGVLRMSVARAADGSSLGYRWELA